MASSGKRKTTMAKLNRERRLIERRQEKQAKKVARRAAAHDPDPPSDTLTPNDAEVQPGRVRRRAAREPCWAGSEV